MVNTSDINKFQDEKIIVKSTILETIFASQQNLLDKYRTIEEIPDKVDFNNADHQNLLKLFTFRGIEELAEAYEALQKGEGDHYIEELSDALHFFTEVLILSGLNHYDIVEGKMYNLDNWIKGPRDILDRYHTEFMFWIITYMFSISCNSLKNKPWKKTQVLTDVNDYKKRLIGAYRQFLLILSQIGFSGPEILEIYRKKNSVNHFRIRSSY